MYGHHTGAIEVVAEHVTGDRTLLWDDAGRMGNRWMTRSLTQELQAGDRLMFVGIRGTGYSGDIGLDTISFKSRECL